MLLQEFDIDSNKVHDDWCTVEKVVSFPARCN